MLNRVYGIDQCGIAYFIPSVLGSFTSFTAYLVHQLISVPHQLDASCVPLDSRLPFGNSTTERATLTRPMAAQIPKKVPLEMAQMSQSDLPLHVMGCPPLLPAQTESLEQEQLPSNDGGKARKPLSFYMTFLALNICVLLVSLDATALAVVVPVS